MATAKSAVVCSILLSFVPAQANRTPSHRLGPFRRPGWRGNGVGGGGGPDRRPGVPIFSIPIPSGGDGGGSAVAEEVATDADWEKSLDERVNAAMRRLGLLNDDEAPQPGAGSFDGANPPQPDGDEGGADCEGGVFAPEQPSETAAPDDIAAGAEKEVEATPATEEDMYALADRISSEMSVPRDIVLAAIYSSYTGEDGDRRIDEDAARSIVQAEADAIAGVPEDCDEARRLVGEGFDPFLARRSLAFSDMDVENARAILVADREDEEAERAAAEEIEAAAAGVRRKEEETPPMRTVTVDYPKDIDSLASTAASAAAAAPPPPQLKNPEGPPPPANREDVIFEGTTEDLQKLVVESPVPVLLDVYADWCGPCKQLTPALEQICINAGGMLRLVKVNTDQQRQISSALEVKALPTIFGIRDGKILNSFQGMPRNEQMVRDFLMGLMVPGQSFNPPVTAEESGRYDDLSNKILKLAAGASFSFSARERLQSHVGKLLDQLVDTIGGETGMAVADDSARVLRSLLSNVIANPFEEKYRRVKLDNRVVAAKVAPYQPCISILKSVGFAPEGDSMLVVAKGKRVVNIAPFVVGRECIDKWIDKNRYHIAAAGRKRKDEMERARLAAEAEEAAKNRVNDEEEEDDESEDEVDPNLCIIKLRLEGKKKVHSVEMNADDSLSTLRKKLPFPVDEGETVQFTCVAKRLIVKSTDANQMSKTLSQHRLAPVASIVVKAGAGNKDDGAWRGGLAERAALIKKKKTGSHSMHSIGLYAKDDGSKAETFESGGVLYDHDISDDEEEEAGGEAEGNNEEKGNEDGSEPFAEAEGSEQ